MFEHDRRYDWERSALRLKVPPEDVEVDMTRVLPPLRLRWGTETPIWCRAFGVGGHWVRGKLTAWVMSDTGDWWALVDLTLVSRNQLTTVDALPLVQKAAVRKVTEP